jgi:hypothetical protein
MRREPASQSEHLLDDASEYAVAEVRLVDEAARIVREGEGTIPVAFLIAFSLGAGMQLSIAGRFEREARWPQEMEAEED